MEQLISFKSLRAAEERSVRESHYDHTLKGLFREGGNIPAIWAKSTGKDTRVIGLTWVDEYQAILTLPNSEITQPADLQGRKLGLPRRIDSQIDFSRAMALRGFLSALSLADLNGTHVKFVDATHFREAAELLSKEINNGIDAKGWEQSLRNRPWGLVPPSQEFIAEQQYAADVFHRFGLLPNSINVSEALLTDPLSVFEANLALASR